MTKLFCVTVALLLQVGNGFNVGPSVKPGLIDLANAQPSQKLSINLDIGKAGSDSRLPIKGLAFDLLNEIADAKESVKMPGISGLSSGARKLNLLKEGEFVSLAGSQFVKALKGCWEMVWKKDAPAGSLTCGFEVPQDYNRNDAKLPQGTLFLSFNVFTAESLAFAQAKKASVMEKAKAAMKEKDDALEKYMTDPNILMKAIHYRNAASAAEKLTLHNVKAVKGIPDSTDDVLQLQKDLFCTTQGKVWSQTGNGHVLLGTATLVPMVEEA